MIIVIKGTGSGFTAHLVPCAKLLLITERFLRPEHSKELEK